MEIKHVIFFMIVLFGVPASVVFMRTNEKIQKTFIFLAVFMIPFVYSTGINFFTDEFYRGTSRGFEVLAVDLVIISLIGMLITTSPKKNLLGNMLQRDISMSALAALDSFKWYAPGAIFYFMYFALCCVSIINTDSQIYAGYELMKMFFMYLYFITMYNCILRYRDFNIILYALSTIILYNLIYMLYQKFLLGTYQPSGIFPHRNSAAAFANVVAPIFLSIILNLKLSKKKFRIYLLSYICCAAIVVVALSRGALFFFPIATAMTVFFSFLHSVDRRKLKIVVALGVAGLIGVIRVAPMIIDRFENAPEASTEGRVQLARAAVNMAQDKFFGVGVNNWGIKINYPYTYTEGTGMVRPNIYYKSGLVETVYLLIAAECGWITLVVYFIWFGYYYVQCVLNMRRYRHSNIFFLPAGIIGGLSAVYGQSTLEWLLKQPTNFYQLMLVFAMIAAITKFYRIHEENLQAQQALKKWKRG